MILALDIQTRLFLWIVSDDFHGLLQVCDITETSSTLACPPIHSSGVGEPEISNGDSLKCAKHRFKLLYKVVCVGGRRRNQQSPP